MAGEMTVEGTGGYWATTARGDNGNETTTLAYDADPKRYYRIYFDFTVAVPVHAFRFSIKPNTYSGSSNTVHWYLTEDRVTTHPPEDADAMATDTFLMNGNNRVEASVTMPEGLYLMPGTIYRMWIMKLGTTQSFWYGIPDNEIQLTATDSGGLVHFGAGESVVSAIPYAKVDGALVQLLPYVKSGGALKIGV